MKALIDTTSNTVLAITDTDTDFGGPWGEMVKSGAAVYSAVPDGELLSDCDVVKNTLVVNVDRKNARLGKADVKTQLKSRIKSYDDDTATAAQKKQFLKDLKAFIADLIGE